jgi:hypothetical protein
LKAKRIETSERLVKRMDICLFSVTNEIEIAEIPSKISRKAAGVDFINTLSANICKNELFNNIYICYTLNKNIL